MKGWLITADGTRWALPEMVEWELDYGCATPCDSFRVVCLWSGGQEQVLGHAFRFEAREGQETVFVGVVDECRVEWNQAGSRLEITGRGLAALLLDNEAESADYHVATVQDILNRHVLPYGIEVAQQKQLPAVHGFSVSAGSSEWSVLYQFARFYAGVTPRFDRNGRLVLGGWEDGVRTVIDDTSPVTGMVASNRRYGVLSEVWVRDRGKSAAVEKVVDEEFSADGGSCRRLFTMPEKSNYQTMRYQGKYQLERSRERKEQLEIELAIPFAAWPGDLVRVERTGWGHNGLWRVARAEVGMGAGGYRTRLELLHPEIAL